MIRVLKPLLVICGVFLLSACTTPQQPTASGVVCLLASCQVNITSDRMGNTRSGTESVIKEDINEKRDFKSDGKMDLKVPNLK